jgi:UDP-3-O-[3-hydroxymyristoyl] N-acetylglucosamine deacetylase / 3-hydroxyacyl-[acyl-carrier-protein] dehydratase
LCGCDIDNLIIELNASEPPIMDGSSKYFVEALEQAEVVEQRPSEKYMLSKKLFLILMKQPEAKS